MLFVYYQMGQENRIKRCPISPHHTAVCKNVVAYIFVCETEA
uniref:Uncharacterized protein n=1 Tax=Ciona intestinalis TaxID=7719 RepID=F6SE15_CIOIN